MPAVPGGASIGMLKLAAPVGLTLKPTGVSKRSAAELTPEKMSKATVNAVEKNAAEMIATLVRAVCCAIT